ncbi:MAG: protein translocase subunit SecD [Clostridia bacterium]
MNFSRAVGIARFVLVVLCITLILTASVCGIEAWKFGGIFEDGTIVLGLDLSGGSRITFSAKTNESGTDLASGMDSVLTAMRTRLDNAGYTEANAYLVGSNMICVEIPGIDDPNTAVTAFGATAHLSFRDYTGKELLSGDDVDNAAAVYQTVDDGTSQYMVSLKFTKEGAEKFAAATKAAASQSKGNDYLAIYMDEKLISQPTVSEEITGGNAVISQGNGMEVTYCQTLAGNINAGALKYDLELEELRSIGPSLGEKSLSTSLKAGLLGIALVAIFMIAYYRLPGAMSVIALTAYTGIFMLMLIITKANLTLPGIAGIVLSIGMAVDANVVVFERIKEEIRGGKSAKAAIKSGYSHAFSAVLDSNITTFIAAGVLYVLGSGTIRGFAVTLGLGVLISFFTAIVLTRLLLNLGCDMGLVNINLYGVKERSTEQ